MLTEHGMPIAPSTYYARPTAPVSAAELADAYAANILVDLHRTHRGLYGVRKLWHVARRAGHPWGRDQGGGSSQRRPRHRRDRRQSGSWSTRSTVVPSTGRACARHQSQESP